MKDTQLYEQLLGLSKPWSVSRVELELEHNRSTVRVECDKGVVWGDPERRAKDNYTLPRPDILIDAVKLP